MKANRPAVLLVCLCAAKSGWAYSAACRVGRRRPSALPLSHPAHGQDKSHCTSNREFLNNHSSITEQPADILDQTHKTRLNRRGFLAAALVTLPTAARATDHKVQSGEVPKQMTPPTTTTLANAAAAATATTQSASGIVAGAALTCAKIATKYPLDTVSVRLQMKNSNYSYRDMRRLFHNCYRGILPPLFCNVPAGAGFFAMRDMSQTFLTNLGASPWAATAVAVGLAQLPFWMVRNPTEVVRTRQMVNAPGYEAHVGPWQAYRQVWIDTEAQSGGTQPGYVGYYVGFWENVVCAYPGDVIKFICYDILTANRPDMSPAEGALAGALSTAFAQFLVTPLDVARNRLMAVGGENDSKIPGAANDDDDDRPASAARGAAQYVHSLIQLGREEGLPGLFAGVSPRVAKSLASGAMQFAAYEQTKQIASRLMDAK